MREPDHRVAGEGRVIVGWLHLGRPVLCPGSASIVLHMTAASADDADEISGSSILLDAQSEGNMPAGAVNVTQPPPSKQDRRVKRRS